MEQEKKNLVQVGDTFFQSATIKELIEKDPYMSFIVLSAALEFLGKCYKLPRTFMASGSSSQDCYDVINKLGALESYRDLNYKEKDKNGQEKERNYLYTGLRCGILHSLLPANEIILTPKENDPKNRKIGAETLYADLCNAWSELKAKEDILQEMEKTTALYIIGSCTGGTIDHRYEISK
ncbi:MAG: hypothetical protein IJT90_00640 [Bacteroidaceae bacterium]|nr:hypothetical protein [Bacteroidaceae bacterium]